MFFFVEKFVLNFLVFKYVIIINKLEVVIKLFIDIGVLFKLFLKFYNYL